MSKKTLTVQVLDGDEVIYSVECKVERGQEGGLVRLIDDTLDNGEEADEQA